MSRAEQLPAGRSRPARRVRRNDRVRSPIAGLILTADIRRSRSRSGTVTASILRPWARRNRGSVCVADGATAETDCTVLLLPRDELRRLIAENRAVARFFDRGRGPGDRGAEVAMLKVGELMSLATMPNRIHETGLYRAPKSMP